jgi:pyruvate/2-oxoglutarate dehydrogenase complex dihydrolipoamide dehydrogenase (E3) component
MSKETPIKTIVYDFIVIGHGNAGQSAVRTLREKCPNATIAVVDPSRYVSIKKEGRVVEYYRETVTGFHPSSRTVQLLSDPKTQLQYKHGILVATGARGAPPPLELFEASSLSRVLELRTTELLGNPKRPIMAPERVRHAVIDASSRGGKIAVLGSGWEALDIVCAAAKAGRKQPTLVFGNPGPVWNILPQYLSSELRKKLVKKDIDIQDRSIVRYVADIHHSRTKKLELHTAKTYDMLETRRTVLDLLVGTLENISGGSYCLFV